jgi:hypothetical protein
MNNTNPNLANIDYSIDIRIRAKIWLENEGIDTRYFNYFNITNYVEEANKIFREIVGGRLSNRIYSPIKFNGQNCDMSKMVCGGWWGYGKCECRNRRVMWVFPDDVTFETEINEDLYSKIYAEAY